MPEVWTPPTFDDIATDELVTAAYLNQLGNSLRFLKQINMTEYTADVSVTATTVGTANQIVTSGAITYENVPHEIDFYCPAVLAGANQVFVIVRDSTTVLGTLMRRSGNADTMEMRGTWHVTPSAASHTYNIAAWTSAAGAWTFNAGTGGTAGDAGTDLAGFIRVRRIPT